MQQIDPAIAQLRKLDKIADQDSIYNGWKQSRTSNAAAFEAFADSQPENIREMLWGYACGTQMMLQRKVLLACMHMVFEGE